ncbi:MAG: hypothetical protein JNM32_07285 [Dechloromonas sp.]|nr:hypothetical protein [Dechloromonas sp.]
MVGFQPRKNAPLHPLGFAPFRIRYPGFPSEPLSDGVSPPHRSIIFRFPLALKGHLVTVPTGEDRTAEKNCRTPPGRGKVRLSAF